MGYDARKVERRWQRAWEDAGVYRIRTDRPGEPFYCLEMLPYPSGRIHMGHVRNYSIGDAVARFEAMRGRNVFHAIGWDALGLPAENAAIRNGVPPARWTFDNIRQMRAQLERLGFSYDWSHEIATCHPGYYRWNQWFFLRMLERDLAYRARRSLNWCSECNTVLANEQVTAAGGCWRHEDTPVSQVELDQWFLRTTRYAERLHDGLDALAGGWPERVLTMQRHWIGRSEGCRFTFELEGGPADAGIEVFTTRVDTVYGCSAVFVAPGHPNLETIVGGGGNEDDVRRFVEAQAAAAARPLDEREKEGVFTGRHALNPFSGERVPVWVANFVLTEFGTGAVFAQPAHDQRDFEFARKYGLAVRPVVRPGGDPLPDPGRMDEAYPGEGVLEGSGPFSGMTTAEARRAMTRHAEEKGFGRAEVQFRLKDWGVSRQRYWGTPIPVVYCDECGIVPVPDDELPVLLPEVDDWRGATGNPLARIESFVNVDCPRCGGPARRETDTMDTFVDSSWYFLRYLDPRNEERPFEPELARTWMPVDLYIGGIEHAVGHLIYARFWTMALRDLGLVPFEEPVVRLFTQGMITAASYRCATHGFIAPDDVDTGDGEPACPRCGEALDVRVEKMSKSKLNSVSPDELIERHGSDALRVFSMFGGPPVKDLEWNEQGIEGAQRFVHRVARLAERLAPVASGQDTSPGALDARCGEGPALELRRKTHRTIQKVTHDIEVELQLNTAIAALMELVNDLYRIVERPADRGMDAPGVAPAVAEALFVLSRLLSPFAPHLAEEVGAFLEAPGLVAEADWPRPDPALLVEDVLTLPVQVNGKLRGQVGAPRGADEATVLGLVERDEAIARHLDGKTIARVIHVPDRLINLVVR